MFLFLLLAAVFLIVTARVYKAREEMGTFDPGEPPRRARLKERVVQSSQAEDQRIELGDGIFWSPQAHPNPHVLIVGASGSGKSWAIRMLTERLIARGYRCILFDFHGDLAVKEAVSHRIALDSDFGVNPLEISFDPTGGGPDPQRFEVLDQLKNAFKPMGSLQLVLLDECLKSVYRKCEIHQNEPAAWREKPMPHFGDLLTEIERRMAENTSDVRLRGLRAKLSLAFDFQIFSKPQVPHPSGINGGPKGMHLELSKLPVSLQYLAADTLLKQILRQEQLRGTKPLGLYVIVDESKLCTPSKKDSALGALNRIATEGRKFGIGLIVSSQFVGHLGRDIVVNTFTKILMRTDQTEIAATARKFRVDEALLSALGRPGDALVNFAESGAWREVCLGRRASA